MTKAEMKDFCLKSENKVVFSDEFYEKYVDGFEPRKNKKLFYMFVKRAFDITVSLLALTILSPAFVIVALAVAIDSGRPIVFVQQRMGRNQTAFNCLKFRTMKTSAPHDMATSRFKDAEKYYTRVGRFLRKTSLDELPQFFNVLTGSMSLVGYRPLVLEEKKCNDMRSKMGVFSMRPGITGFAQVNGRNDVYYKNKAIMDAYYVKNASVWMDLKIMFKSLFVVFTSKGNKNS